MPIDLKQLTAFDTPTICNVIELFEVRPRNRGYMDSRIRPCFPELPPIAGWASTATIRCAFPAREGNSYGSLEQQVEAFAELPGPPIVVFQDLDDPAAGATFGEVMCAVYQTFGAAGLITSGAARDLDQVRRLKFAAFSNGTICAHGCTHIVDVHRPVCAGGIPIHPGDLLHADANGVTSIPSDIASEVAGVATEYMKAESLVLNYLRTRTPDLKDFSDARRGMMEAFASLRQRLRPGLGSQVELGLATTNGR